MLISPIWKRGKFFVKGLIVKKNKPQFLFDEDGNKAGVLLSIADFEAMMRELEDYYDYKVIIERSKKKYKTYTKDEVIKSIEKRQQC